MSRVIACAQMILHHVNLPRIVCEHVVGDNHSQTHRRIVGGAVMVAGVWVAKTAAHIHYEPFEFAGDLLGYLIHGFGAVPYIEGIVASIKTATTGDGA